MKKLIFTLGFVTILVASSMAQESTISDGQNINVFTGGLFMSKGRWEAKIYNNLYTQIEPQFNAADRRSSFNTSFLQITVGSNHNLNYGLDFLYKSNIVNDAASSSPFQVFQFMQKNVQRNEMGNEFNTQFSRGLTHFGPRLRTKPFKNKRFTFQQAAYIPTGKLDEGWIINSDLFYEHVINGKYMVFGNVGAWYPLSGEIFPYARVFAGTLLAKRFGPFVMLNLPYEIGAGTKLFITRKIELEFMYTYWLPIESIVDNRMPTSLNFALRITNFNNF